MTTKEYLMQARAADIGIQAKVEQVERLRSQLTRCTQALSGMPGGGHADWTDTIARVLELEADINREIDRLTDLKQEIRKAVSEVQDDRYRRLLELRYLNGWSWQKIAEAMHYDRMTIWRMHGRALAAIERCYTMLHRSVV